MLPADSLPASLRTVRWTYQLKGDAGACSIQPLLKLSCLEELALKFYRKSLPVTEELRQLASLQHLKAVWLSDNNAAATLSSRVDQVWSALPLTCLALRGFSSDSNGQSILMPAVALHALSELTLLKSLTLSYDKYKDVEDIEAPGGQCITLVTGTSLPVPYQFPNGKRNSLSVP
jgi:hypothetical protein